MRAPRTKVIYHDVIDNEWQTGTYFSSDRTRVIEDRAGFPVPFKRVGWYLICPTVPDDVAEEQVQVDQSVGDAIQEHVPYAVDALKALPDIARAVLKGFAITPTKPAVMGVMSAVAGGLGIPKAEVQNAYPASWDAGLEELPWWAGWSGVATRVAEQKSLGQVFAEFFYGKLGLPETRHGIWADMKQDERDAWEALADFIPTPPPDEVRVEKADVLRGIWRDDVMPVPDSVTPTADPNVKLKNDWDGFDMEEGKRSDPSALFERVGGQGPAVLTRYEFVINAATLSSAVIWDIVNRMAKKRWPEAWVGWTNSGGWLSVRSDAFAGYDALTVALFADSEDTLNGLFTSQRSHYEFVSVEVRPVADVPDSRRVLLKFPIWSEANKAWAALVAVRMENEEARIANPRRLQTAPRKGLSVPNSFVWTPVVSKVSRGTQWKVLVNVFRGAWPDLVGSWELHDEHVLCYAVDNVYQGQERALFFRDPATASDWRVGRAIGISSVCGVEFNAEGMVLTYPEITHENHMRIDSVTKALQDVEGGVEEGGIAGPGPHAVRIETTLTKEEQRQVVVNTLYTWWPRVCLADGDVVPMLSWQHPGQDFFRFFRDPRAAKDWRSGRRDDCEMVEVWFLTGALDLGFLETTGANEALVDRVRGDVQRREEKKALDAEDVAGGVWLGDGAGGDSFFMTKADRALCPQISKLAERLQAFKSGPMAGSWDLTVELSMIEILELSREVAQLKTQLENAYDNQ